MQPVALFCAEYAVLPSLRTYVGELGVRAADLLAAAGDLEVPLVAVGLFHASAFVTEEIAEDGHRRVVERRNDPDALPLERVLGPDGAPLSVTIMLAEREVELGAWELGVGRARLILLDTNLEHRPAAERELTGRLHPPGTPARAQQDELLRRGGEGMLGAMGITPGVLHFEDGQARDIHDGIHLPSWVSADVVEALGVPAAARICGRDFAERVDQVKTRALWNLRARARERMVEQLYARGLSAADSDALWIGCAGRFGAGTRADLLFGDLARLERLLDDPVNPVRLVFTGDADPDDELGQAQLAKLAELSRDARFEGRIVFAPDPGLEIWHILVEGVDLWLSTPTRGAGARGTWGVRAAANGALNVSIADGWWAAVAAEDEACERGWTIGGARELDEQAAQDAVDARMLFALLERDIVPMFYDWDSEAIPLRWVERIRASMRSIPVEFDAERMVRAYMSRAWA